MKLKTVLSLIIAGFFFTSCGFLFKEELTFDKARVPGEYEGTITCSYDPCELEGPTTFTITEAETYFTLQFEDSLSAQIPDLNFEIELGEESFGEAVTVSGYFRFPEDQPWQLTPYDQHIFYYWTFYDDQQEGERFEIMIYEPGPDNNAPADINYLELNGHKGIQ